MLEKVARRLRYNIGMFEMLVGLFSLGIASVIYRISSRPRGSAPMNQGTSLLAAGTLTVLLARKVSKTG